MIKGLLDIIFLEFKKEPTESKFAEIQTTNQKQNAKGTRMEMGYLGIMCIPSQQTVKGEHTKANK